MRFWRPTRELLAAAHMGAYLGRARGRLTRGVPAQAHSLFLAAQYTRAAPLRWAIRRAVEPWVERQAPSVRTSPDRVHEIRSVLLLKPPGPGGEKGVLFAGNETPWPDLVEVARASDLFDAYDLVALSAWSPPKYGKLAGFVGLSKDPIYIGISNVEDLVGYQLLAPAITPLPLMASDWLNPDDFNPRPRAQRDIDVLMVAGWGRYKRHWLLFEALHGLPSDLNVVLIGGKSGQRTVEDVKAEARLFGVAQDLTFKSDVPIHEVYEYQARARTSVIFSGREGACVAVTESFFANTPVGMMHDAHVGSKAHVNAATGVLFRRHDLSRQLGAFLESSDQFSPREWALDHVSCHRSSSKLNELLHRQAVAAGRPWTNDLAPLFRRYFVPRYLRPEDEETLAAARQELRSRYGLNLVPPEQPANA